MANADRFNPCLLIPIYNHAEPIKKTVAALLSYGLKIIIIDDGSDTHTQSALQAIASEQPLVALFRLPHNLGKGGAVMQGFKEAARLGFTHALQIDADGQHDVRDLDTLLDLAASHPAAVISGQPQYDESIPKARLYGRYITHFWVWIETLSGSIKDAMCGFRAYPLAPCIELMERQELGRRMDFDIEILVRLYWQGLDVIHFPTQVIYPEEGVSHFQGGRDNWLISKMHCRLFFGMLARIPKLIARRKGLSHPAVEKNSPASPEPATMRSRDTHWSAQRERGARWGILLMLRVYQLLGHRGAKLLLYPVIGYFFLFSRQSRRHSIDYLSRLAHTAEQQKRPHPKVCLRTSFNHFMAFGDAVLDKLAAWMGEIPPEKIGYQNRDAVVATLNRGQGVMMIGSHLGNLEICRAIGNALPDVTINALVFTEHAAHFNAVLKEVNPAVSLNLIEVSTLGPEMALTLKDKIDAGEVVVIVADRTSTTARDRVVMQPFLGTPAPFPEGPFVLASLMRCPVYLLFCLNRGQGFEVIFEPFADPLLLPRKTRQSALQGTVARYAERLQYHCLSAPLQWFNFFDFWHAPSRTRTHDDT